MDNSLITKKELLELYGISYGALYRWKRKGLIPDEWFIRRSTFTGQETFLPRDKIIDRVELILRLKDTMSLDEIADSFVPGGSGTNADSAAIVRLGIADSETLERYCVESGKSPPFGWDELYELALCSAGGSLAAARCAIGFIRTNKREAELYIAEKDGVSVACCSAADSRLCFSADCRVRSISTATVAAELRQKLARGDG